MSYRSFRWWLATATLPLTACDAPAPPSPDVLTVARKTAVALGGEEAVRGLERFTLVAEGNRKEHEQTRSPGDEALAVSTLKYTLNRDVSADRIRMEWQRMLAYPAPVGLNYTEVLDRDQGMVDGPDGLFSPPRAPMLSARVATRRKQLRLSSPAELVKRALEHSEDLSASEETEAGVPVTVLEIPDVPRPIRLVLEARTNLPLYASTLEDDPVYGDTEVRFGFDDWRLAGALRFPFLVRQYLNNRLVLDEKRIEVRVGELPAEGAFEIPASFRTPEDTADRARGERSSEWFERFISSGLPMDFDQSRSVELREVASGVFHVIGGSHHSMVIELANELIVVEAPIDGARSLAVLAAIATRWPNKPVKTLVNTHFHYDHSGGIRAFAGAGAAVVTAQANELFLKTMLAAPHTVHPDALAKSPRDVTLRLVKGDEALSIGDATREVRVVPVQGVHSTGMVVVYLPKEGILFTSDLFSPGAFPEGAPMPPPFVAWAKDLQVALSTTEALTGVTTIVGGHGSRAGTREELAKVAAGP